MKTLNLKSGIKGLGHNGASYPVNKSEQKENTGPCIGQRHVAVGMGFLIMTSTSMVRQVFSVSLVAMVNYTAIGVEEKSSNETSQVHGECYLTDDIVVEKLKDGEFAWDAELQGLLAGAFFWGSVASMVPSSFLAQRYGGKTITLLSTLFVGASCLLTPWAANTGVPCLLLFRCLAGLGLGANIVAISTLLTRWVPANERGRLNAYTGSGSPCGILLATSLTGVITDSPWFVGWPSAFYIFGVACLISAILWAFLVYENPSVHPWISEEERIYIEKGTGVTKAKLPTPWCTIMTSVPVWALVMASFGYGWTSLSMSTLIPSYMRTILHFNIKENGFLSSLPYLGRLLISNISSSIGDRCVEKGIPRNVVRKTLATMCLLLPGIFLVLAMYAPCDRTVSVSLLVLGTSVAGCAFPSIFINQTDLSPNFAGPILSFVALFANLSGIVAQYTAGAMLTDLGDISNWRLVMYTGFGINIVALGIFLLFGTAEQQSWNQAGNEKGDNSVRPSLTSVATL